MGMLGLPGKAWASDVVLEQKYNLVLTNPCVFLSIA